MVKKNNLSVLSKLEKVHEYIKQLIADEILPNDKKLLNHYIIDIRCNLTSADIIYRYMTEVFVEDSKPKTAKQNAYKKLASKEYFKCSNDYDNLARLLTEDKPYYEGGIFANGIYCSENLNAANKRYKDYNDDGSEPCHLKFKLNSNRIISKDELYNEFVCLSNGQTSMDSFLHDRENELAMFLVKITDDDIFDSNLFINLLENDAGKLGLILGFDAIDVENNGENIAILNPGKIVVNSSEFDRVCESSDSFSDYASQKQ